MKYMGSKRVMLQNGLGDLLTSEAASASRVVDLFCGASSVAWFAATKLNKPVHAVDLQEYAAILAAAVVRRSEPLSPMKLEREWLGAAVRSRLKFHGWKEASELDGRQLNTASWRSRAQELCRGGVATTKSVVFTKYGGHYFSPTQALSFDAMLHALPGKAGLRDACLAAVIIAASRCAASPGHTAQPFKATRSAARYLREAWLRDPFDYARQAVRELAPLHASQLGDAEVGDANVVANSLLADDLVFVDPPYSGVHYSRFYHVLETIARGTCGPVEGVGRYPPPSERPNSAYSRRDKSGDAMDQLLQTLADRGCRVIVTFPRDVCSNGLSGHDLEEMSRAYFKVARKCVKTRFSTLGGNSANRAARKVADELMLVLRPQ